VVRSSVNQTIDGAGNTICQSTLVLRCRVSFHPCLTAELLQVRQQGPSLPC